MARPSSSDCSKSGGRTLGRQGLKAARQSSTRCKEYIPRTDLLRATSTDMVRQVLLEDPIPEQQQLAQDAFVGEVLDRARKLLATCV